MDEPVYVWTVLVGFTSRRPVVPDEHFATVLIASTDEIDAQLAATQMVACWPHCVMPTSSKVIDAYV